MGLLVAVVLGICWMPQSALAWGERGHQIMVDAAIELLMQPDTPTQELGLFLDQHREALRYFVHVPDRAWGGGVPVAEDTSGDEDTTGIDGPVHEPSLHRVQLENVLHEIVFHRGADIAVAWVSRHFRNKSWQDMADDMHYGILPWRIVQADEALQEAFEKLRTKQRRRGSKAARATPTQVRQILGMAGVVAHYAGDLSQPYRSTLDRDGWEKGLGGAHGYLESDIVDAIPAGLTEKVTAEVQATRGLEVFMHDVPKAQHNWVKESPLALAWVVLLNSWSGLPVVQRLDRRLAVLGPSATKPVRHPARRKPAVAVASKFETWVVRRLALGAAVAAEYWYRAWQAAERPDLTKLRWEGRPKPPRRLPWPPTGLVLTGKKKSESESEATAAEGEAEDGGDSGSGDSTKAKDDDSSSRREGAQAPPSMSSEPATQRPG